VRLRWLTVLALAAVTVALVCVYDRALLHFFGWDGQSSDNYAAWSGSVPALFTLVGLSTIISGIWHGLNCHEQGCWRYGRHRVNGSPWCNHHQDNARPERTEHELLEEISGTMTQILEAVTALVERT
jgi:hypothetical protein